MKRFILFLWILLACAGSQGDAFAASKAQIFDALLTSQRASGVTLSGGKAYFYVPGTETLKPIYANRNKTVVAANPYTLSSDGTAMVYGDGLYDVKITNSANVQKYLWEDVKLFDSGGLYYVEPEEFGAVADGVTPSGAAINAALATLTSGGKLQLRAGVYNCDDAQIEVTTDNIEIVGSGVSTVIKRTVGDIMFIHGVIANRATDYASGNFANHVQFVKVKDLAFDGGDKANNFAAIKEEVVFQNRYENLWFDNINIGVISYGSFQSQYINFRNTLARTDQITVNYFFYTDLSLENPSFRTGDLFFSGWQTKAAKTHIYAKGTWDGTPDPGADNLIDGANVEGSIFYNGEHAIHFIGNTWASINNNKTFNIIYDHVILDKTRTMQVTGNNFTWNTFNTGLTATDYAHGVKIIGDPAYKHKFSMTTRGGTNQISDNIMYQLSGAGIYAKDTYGIQITNNMIYDPNYNGFMKQTGAGAYLGTLFTQDGIYVEGCVGGLIEGNRVNPGWYTFEPSTDQIPRHHRWDVFVDSTSRGITVKHDFDYESLVSPSNTLAAADTIATERIPTGFLNYMPFPEAFNNWTPGGSTGPLTADVSGANTQTDPEGGNTADTIVLKATTAAQTSYAATVASPTLAAVTGKTVTFSVYLKAASDTSVQIGIADTLTAGSNHIKTVHVGTTWKRYWFSHTYGTATGNAFIIIGHFFQAHAEKSLYAWGAQLELSSEMNKYVRKTVYVSAIPTTGAWRVGDRMVLIPPVVGQPKAWVNTITGTPGTIVSEGNL